MDKLKRSRVFAVSNTGVRDLAVDTRGGHMPSDQDESRAVLQQTSASEWVVPMAQVPVIANGPSNENDQFADDQFDDQFADDQFVEEAITTDDLMAPDTESDLLQWSTPPPLVSKESLGTFWRQFTPILVPLPFGLLIFGATLPATLQGLSANHPSVLIMAILLLVLMLIQGTLLYFAGSNDTLLTLYIVGGYALFIIAGVFAAFGTMPALFTFVILIIAGLLLARRGIHPTREGHVDIITSFGKYAQTFEPGLNLLLPWERVECRLNTQETTWTTPKMEVLTARDQKVELTATISYQLLPEDAYLAATNVKNWETSLQELFPGTVQSMVNELTIADFVAWTQSIYARPAHGEASSFNPAAATRWDRINNTLSRRMQDQVATWGRADQLGTHPGSDAAPNHNGRVSRASSWHERRIDAAHEKRGSGCPGRRASAFSKNRDDARARATNDARASRYASLYASRAQRRESAQG